MWKAVIQFIVAAVIYLGLCKLTDTAPTMEGVNTMLLLFVLGAIYDNKMEVNTFHSKQEEADGSEGT